MCMPRCGEPDHIWIFLHFRVHTLGCFVGIPFHWFCLLRWSHFAAGIVMKCNFGKDGRFGRIARGSLVLPVWCHADVAHSVGMDEPHDQFVVSCQIQAKFSKEDFTTSPASEAALNQCATNITHHQQQDQPMLFIGSSVIQHQHMEEPSTTDTEEQTAAEAHRMGSKDNTGGLVAQQPGYNNTSRH
ncbi:hypothetical protein Nepgr_021439 [Nepenthes gracilis]|uniref:Uncharacterized protein n=1 Tax=Nepenthes gracilis TaxID=150966 RepID=A0AAD3SY63_NEPGR|nr:hypothetical protein Nepgr_021439 [Nepenthes gracilis]